MGHGIKATRQLSGPQEPLSVCLHGSWFPVQLPHLELYNFSIGMSSCCNFPIPVQDLRYKCLSAWHVHVRKERGQKVDDFRVEIMAYSRHVHILHYNSTVDISFHMGSH